MTSRIDARQEAAQAIRKRLDEQLPRVDPHHRLAGRPVSYRVLEGRTLEITYRDVVGITEAELAGVKRVIGAECSWSLSPQTAETLIVRFVVELK
jgi:hypothetical protein